MLTGLYPWNLYPPGERGYLSASVKTMAEILKNKGYKTAAFTDGLYLSKVYRLNRGFEIFESHYTALKNIGVKQNVIRSISFIQKHTQKKGGQPFFLFLHTYDAHEPFTPSHEVVRAIEHSANDTGGIDLLQIIKMNQLGPPQPELIQKIQLLYQAEIFEIDLQLGHLFQELRKLDLLKNTMVIITSDHGEEMGEHGIWGLHGHSSYNELLHIPLVFYVPGEMPEKILSPVSLIDILPTVLAQTKIAQGVLHIDGLPLPETDNPGTLARKILALGANLSKPHLLAFMYFIWKKLKEPLDPIVTAPSKEQNSLPGAQELVLITKNKKFILKHSPLGFTTFDFTKDPKELSPTTLECNNEFCETVKLFFAFSDKDAP